MLCEGAEPSEEDCSSKKMEGCSANEVGALRNGIFRHRCDHRNDRNQESLASAGRATEKLDRLRTRTSIWPRSSIKRADEMPKKREDPAFYRGMGRTGFEPVKSKTADLQSAPFGHFGTYPFSLQPRYGSFDRCQGLAREDCYRLNHDLFQRKIVAIGLLFTDGV